MQLISDAQCGNLRIFLTLIFDEKFISVDAESELSDCEFVKVAVLETKLISRKI